MPTSNGSLTNILCDINGTSQFCCPTFSHAEAFKFNASCKKNVNITSGRVIKLSSNMHFMGNKTLCRRSQKCCEYSRNKVLNLPIFLIVFIYISALMCKFATETFCDRHWLYRTCQLCYKMT
jgi:hypothetical protein